MIKRRITRKIYYGSVSVGGDSPVTVQSMTNTKTTDVEGTVAQITELADAGCDIIRVAVPDMESADALPKIIKSISIPLIADIHFDYRLALAAIKAGVHGLRLNPGNIKNEDHIIQVVKEAKSHGIPIRIGANAGSIDRQWIANQDSSLAHSEIVARAMVEGALKQIKILEKLDFYDIVVSLKASDVMTTIESYRLMSEKCDYPFHLGITEAGPIIQGTVKSSAGLGIMLNEGIGDTIRISLSDSPLHEVQVGHMLLRSLGIRKIFPEIVSCPTCGRTRIPVIELAKKVEKELAKIKADITVAVMGCEVNGPGEAREADIGIAGGSGFGILFKKGEVICKIPEDELIIRLMDEINKMVSNNGE